MVDDFDDGGGMSSEAKWVILVISLLVFCLLVVTFVYCCSLIGRRRRRDKRRKASAEGKDDASDGSEDSYCQSLDGFAALLEPSRIKAKKHEEEEEQARYQAGRKAAMLLTRRQTTTVFNKVFIISLNGHKAVGDKSADSGSEDEKNDDLTQIDITNTPVLQEARITLENCCGFNTKARRRRDRVKGARPDIEDDEIVSAALPYQCVASHVLHFRETIAEFAECLREGDRVLLVVLDGDLLMPLQNELLYSGRKYEAKTPQEQKAEEEHRAEALDVVFDYSSSEGEDDDKADADDRNKRGVYESYSALVGRRKRLSRKKTKKVEAVRRRRAVMSSKMPFEPDEIRKLSTALITRYILQRARMREDVDLVVLHDAHPALIPQYSFVKNLRSKVMAGSTVRYTQCDVDLGDSGSEKSGDNSSEAGGVPEPRVSLFVTTEGTHENFTPGALFLSFTNMLKTHMTQLTKLLQLRCRKELCYRHIRNEEDRGHRGAKSHDPRKLAKLRSHYQTLKQEEAQSSKQKGVSWLVPSCAVFTKSIADHMSTGTDDACTVQYQSEICFAPGDKIRFLQRYVSVLQRQNMEQRKRILDRMSPRRTHSSTLATSQNTTEGSNTAGQQQQEHARAVRLSNKALGGEPEKYNPLDVVFPATPSTRQGQEDSAPHTPYTPRQAVGNRAWMMRTTEAHSLQEGRHVHPERGGEVLPMHYTYTPSYAHGGSPAWRMQNSIRPPVP